MNAAVRHTVADAAHVVAQPVVYDGRQRVTAQQATVPIDAHVTRKAIIVPRRAGACAALAATWLATAEHLDAKAQLTRHAFELTHEAAIDRLIARGATIHHDDAVAVPGGGSLGGQAWLYAITGTAG